MSRLNLQIIGASTLGQANTFSSFFFFFSSSVVIPPPKKRPSLELHIHKNLALGYELIQCVSIPINQIQLWMCLKWSWKDRETSVHGWIRTENTWTVTKLFLPNRLTSRTVKLLEMNITIHKRFHSTCSCELEYGDITHFACKPLCYECLQYFERCYIVFRNVLSACGVSFKSGTLIFS